MLLLVQHQSPLMREHGEHGYLYVCVCLCVCVCVCEFVDDSQTKHFLKRLIPFCSHKMFNRKTKPVSYLFDMTHLSNYWGCDGQPARM